jgi:antitoxin ChpS
MTTSTLRKVGGSVVVALPPALLEQLHLEAGETVGLAVEGDHLILKRQRQRYKLEDLLKECDYSLPMSEEDREWLDSPPVGRELI